jgi:hypothetical protein
MIPRITTSTLFLTLSSSPTSKHLSLSIWADSEARRNWASPAENFESRGTLASKLVKWATSTDGTQ